MRDFVKGGVRTTCIQLLFAVELKDDPGLLFKYLIVFFLLLGGGRELVIVLSRIRFDGLGVGLLAALGEVREVEDDLLGRWVGL